MAEPYVVRGDTDEASIARHNEEARCSICYATGEDVWGVEGIQLVLCQNCRVRWRRGLGYPDFSS